MKTLVPFLLSIAVCGVALAAEEGKEVERLQRSAEVIEEIMKTPEQGIPKDLLRKSVCVGVIPSQKKVALGLGGSYGRGCLVCRRGGTGTWARHGCLPSAGPAWGSRSVGRRQILCSWC
jgi:lipid-binding SYLF domain-containing protein